MPSAIHCPPSLTPLRSEHPSQAFLGVYAALYAVRGAMRELCPCRDANTGAAMPLSAHGTATGPDGPRAARSPNSSFLTQRFLHPLLALRRR